MAASATMTTSSLRATSDCASTMSMGAMVPICTRFSLSASARLARSSDDCCAPAGFPAHTPGPNTRSSHSASSMQRSRAATCRPRRDPCASATSRCRHESIVRLRSNGCDSWNDTHELRSGLKFEKRFVEVLMRAVPAERVARAGRQNLVHAELCRRELRVGGFRRPRGKLAAGLSCE